MKIAIVGNYGATNVGDEAILTILLDQLKAFNAEITIFSSCPEKGRDGRWTVPLVPLGFRSFLKYGFFASFRALKKADVVILGGGGLFQDDYLYACFLWGWQVFWVWLLRKPFVIYAAGVGPLQTRIGRKIARWSFDLAEMISVRDQKSANLLKEIGIRKPVHVTADPVFLWKRDGFKCQQPIPEKKKENLLIISLRPWMNEDHRIINVFTSFLQRVKKEWAAEFIFISMQQIREHDLQIIQPIMKACGGTLYVPENFSDLLRLMGTADYAIGMRYHFMIAALLAGTPLLPVHYSPKTEALFYGSELTLYGCQVNHLSPEVLYDCLRRLSADHQHVMPEVAVLCNHLREKAEKGLDQLKDFLSRRALAPKGEGVKA